MPTKRKRPAIERYRAAAVAEDRALSKALRAASDTRPAKDANEAAQMMRDPFAEYEMQRHETQAAGKALIDGDSRRNSDRQRDKDARDAINALVRIHGKDAIALGPLTARKLECYADDLDHAKIPTGSPDGWLPVSVRSLIRRWRERRKRA